MEGTSSCFCPCPMVRGIFHGPPASGGVETHWPGTGFSTSPSFPDFGLGFDSLLSPQFRSSSCVPDASRALSVLLEWSLLGWSLQERL